MELTKVLTERGRIPEYDAVYNEYSEITAQYREIDIYPVQFHRLQPGQTVISGLEEGSDVSLWTVVCKVESATGIWFALDAFCTPDERPGYLFPRQDDWADEPWVWSTNRPV